MMLVIVASLGSTSINESILVVCFLGFQYVIEAFMDYKTDCAWENMALNKYQKMCEVCITVRRDNHLQSIPSTNLVPGDLVYLYPGDILCADARIVSSNWSLPASISDVRGYFLSHSHISVPADPRDLSRYRLIVKDVVFNEDYYLVPKVEYSLPVDSVASERWNMIFAGSMIVRGMCKVLITHTGRNLHALRHCRFPFSSFNKVTNSCTCLPSSTKKKYSFDSVLPHEFQDAAASLFAWGLALFSFLPALFNEYKTSPMSFWLSRLGLYFMPDTSRFFHLPHFIASSFLETCQKKYQIYFSSWESIERLAGIDVIFLESDAILSTTQLNIQMFAIHDAFVSVLDHDTFASSAASTIPSSRESSSSLFGYPVSELNPNLLLEWKQYFPLFVCCLLSSPNAMQYALSSAVRLKIAKPTDGNNSQPASTAAEDELFTLNAQFDRSFVRFLEAVDQQEVSMYPSSQSASARFNLASFAELHLNQPLINEKLEDAAFGFSSHCLRRVAMHESDIHDSDAYRENMSDESSISPSTRSSPHGRVLSASSSTPQRYMIYLRGPPEVILSHSTRILLPAIPTEDSESKSSAFQFLEGISILDPPHHEVVLTAEKTQHLQSQIARAYAAGLRLIAFAQGEAILSAGSYSCDSVVWVGFVAFSHPVSSSVHSAIACLQQIGISVKLVINEPNEQYAEYLIKQTGIAPQPTCCTMANDSHTIIQEQELVRVLSATYYHTNQSPSNLLEVIRVHQGTLRNVLLVGTQFTSQELVSAVSVFAVRQTRLLSRYLAFNRPVIVLRDSLMELMLGVIISRKMWTALANCILWFGASKGFLISMFAYEAYFVSLQQLLLIGIMTLVEVFIILILEPANWDNLLRFSPRRWKTNMTTTFFPSWVSPRVASFATCQFFCYSVTLIVIRKELLRHRADDDSNVDSLSDAGLLNLLNSLCFLSYMVGHISLLLFLICESKYRKPSINEEVASQNIGNSLESTSTLQSSISPSQPLLPHSVPLQSPSTLDLLGPLLQEPVINVATILWIGFLISFCNLCIFSTTFQAFFATSPLIWMEISLTFFQLEVTAPAWVIAVILLTSLLHFDLLIWLAVDTRLGFRK